VKKLSALAVLTALLPACAQLPMSAPDAATAITIGSKFVSAAVPMSDAEETALGKEVAANLCAGFGYRDDAAASKYINLVGQTLARHSGRANIAYHFALLDSETVNAYAAPGGYIFVTKGALKLMENEAEFAAALAHEISHVSSRHIAKEIQKANLVGAGTDVIALMAKDKSQAAALTGFSTDILFKGYSRKDEEEADAKAVEILKAAGYDSVAFTNFLERLASQKADEPRFMVFLKTHPRPEDRIARIKPKTSTGRKNEARFINATSKLKSPR
jgi:predicted Zn-dependent protease